MTTIYLHGFSGNKEGLARFARAMNLHPYHLWVLPGFGGRSVSASAQKSLVEYCNEVMHDMRTTYPGEKFHIVGHSHGAIIAFCLAAQFPHDVDRLTVINPVAKPRVLSRLASMIVEGATYVMPSWMLLRTMRSKRLVDAVSGYMASSHTRENKHHIYEMRRYESKYYTKQMFRLARHATTFASITDQYRVSAPTVIVYDPRDNVAGKDDAGWYASRCVNSTMLVVEGGHLGVVATPEKIADALGNTSEKRIY